MLNLRVRLMATSLGTASLIFMATTASAGITGTITGTVLDQRTSEAIGYATVQVEGTAHGTLADMNGTYFILHVPAGVYTVRAASVGYNVAIEKDIAVAAELTTPLDFALEEQPVQGGIIQIRGKDDIRNINTPRTTRPMCIERISTLPVTRGDLPLQAGVVVEQGDSLDISAKPETVASPEPDSAKQPPALDQADVVESRETSRHEIPNIPATTIDEILNHELGFITHRRREVRQKLLKQDSGAASNAEHNSDSTFPVDSDTSAVGLKSLLPQQPVDDDRKRPLPASQRKDD